MKHHIKRHIIAIIYQTISFKRAIASITIAFKYNCTNKKELQQSKAENNTSILKLFFVQSGNSKKKKKLLNSLAKATLQEFICRSFFTNKKIKFYFMKMQD